MRILIFLLFLSTVSYSQEFKYQRKGEPFPFDSGVSISHRQYVFIQQQQVIRDLTIKTDVAIKKEPALQVKIVEVPVERKKEWHEKTVARVFFGVVTLYVGVKVGSL